MKKLFLHIGYNKTGSSYIQECLFLNHSLLSGAGFFYPSHPNKPYIQNRQHVPLAARISGLPIYWLRPQKKKTLDTTLEEFFQDVVEAPEQKIIVSSEAFGAIEMTRDHVLRVREMLADFDVTVIAYVRRQDDYILSSYQQDVKTGAHIAFRLDDRMERPHNRFSRRVGLWQSVFGDDKVIARPFDKNQWHQKDIFLDFLSVIGAPTEGLRLANPANEGLDYRQISLLRHVNARLASPKSKKGNRHPHRLIRQAILRALNELDLPWEKEKLGLSAKDRGRIAEFFAEENSALFGEDMAQEFTRFKSGPVQGNTDYDGLDPELMLRLIVKLSETLVKERAAKPGDKKTP